MKLQKYQYQLSVLEISICDTGPMFTWYEVDIKIYILAPLLSLRLAEIQSCPFRHIYNTYTNNKASNAWELKERCHFLTEVSIQLVCLATGVYIKLNNRMLYSTCYFERHQCKFIFTSVHFPLYTVFQYHQTSICLKSLFIIEARKT